jgi:hypothetical protein
MDSPIGCLTARAEGDRIAYDLRPEVLAAAEPTSPEEVKLPAITA